MNKFCMVCRQTKKVVAEQLHANGLYGYYCQECNEKEDKSENV